MAAAALQLWVQSLHVNAASGLGATAGVCSHSMAALYTARCPCCCVCCTDLQQQREALKDRFRELRQKTDALEQLVHDAEPRTRCGGLGTCH